MIYAGAEVVFYALAAAGIALVLAATFVVIRSERPRTNGIAFLSGFVFGTLIACGLGLALGQASVARFDSHETFKAVATVGLGLALLVVGHQTPQTTPPGPEVRSSRAAAIVGGLGNVGPAASFSMAGLLGFGGPKRLVLTFLAMASITEAGLRDIVDIPLVVGYVVVSTMLAILARGQAWVSEHATALRKWVSLVVGGALVVDGLLRLLI